MNIKNNKGFTLIELLLTIALLAVISIISFVSINAIISKNKDNDCVSTVNNIIIAAKEYYSDNRYDNTVSSESFSITAASLISNNYLNGEIIDPYEKETVDSNDILVTIYLNDDKTVKDVKVTQNDEAVFNGCKSSNGNVMSGARVPKEPTQSYQINYLLNGGKIDNQAPNTTSYSSAVKISNPTKTINITFNENSSSSANAEGAVFSTTTLTSAATFAGWSSNSSFGLGENAKRGTIDNPNTRWTGNNTTNEYFKHLRDDPGTVTMVANWQEPTITLPTITKENHDCGWTTSKTGATIEYASGENYTPNTNTTKTTINLYAFCELGKYIITVDANGGIIPATTGWTGSGASATKTITYGENYGSLPTPTKTGYTFTGWYTALSGGTKIESTTQMTTGSNHPIYARWTTNELTFNNQTLNNGTYGTAYTSNAFTEAANGTGNYTYTIKSGAPTGAQINSTNRTISFPASTTANTYVLLSM